MVLQFPGDTVPGQAKVAFRERRLRRVLELIETKPESSVRELAELVSLSPAHLQRLFKRRLGANLRDLLVEQRLQCAARLLTSSDLSIKEISFRSGYGHHSSFVRAFQRRFSLAPKHYRQAQEDLIVLQVRNG